MWLVADGRGHLLSQLLYPRARVLGRLWSENAGQLAPAAARFAIGELPTGAAVGGGLGVQDKEGRLLTEALPELAPSQIPCDVV